MGDTKSQEKMRRALKNKDPNPKHLEYDTANLEKRSGFPKVYS